jgi:hypothetical protein
VQDSARTPGSLFFVPFYRNGVHDTVQARRANFTGLVYAPFIVKILMLRTLENAKRNVDIRINEGVGTMFWLTIRCEIYGGCSSGLLFGWAGDRHRAASGHRTLSITPISRSLQSGWRFQ